MKRISIDPITRLEGHGKIDIFLDDAGRRGQRLLADPGAARLRAVLRGPAGRGHAQPDRPDLRRLPRGPPHGGHQGPGRPVPRRSAADGQEAPRAVLQHLLRHRPHDALLRPGRAGLRRRPRRPAGRAQHPRRDQEGRHGHRRQGAQDAPRRPPPDQDDRRPARCIPTGACPAASAAASTRSSARRSSSSGREAIEFAKFSLQALRRRRARRTATT